MRFQLMPLICCLALIASTAVSNASDGVKNSDGAGDSVGQKIDRGLQQIGNELRQGWAEVRNAADRMGVQARVYARLRWDKAVSGATLDVEVPQQGVVVLKGSVPDSRAKQKAARLAQDTVGVDKVVDQLAVAPPR